MGPNCAKLCVGFVEKQIFEQYTDPKPDYLGRYTDDCVGTASCSRGELEQFINYVNNFHPALQFTCEISETSVAFLDILVSINGNRLASHFCSTNPLTPTVIFYIHLPIPTTPKGRSPSPSSFVFAAYAVKMTTSIPKVWK